MAISTTVIAMLGVALLIVSRHCLLRPSSHGFYRLWVFQSILGMLWLSLPHWSANPDSLLQRLSGAMLALSLYLLLHGLYLLLRRGGHSPARRDAANFRFENTARLVDSGLYRYIRHPMYGSLLFLLWGCYLKAPGLASSALVGLGSWALVRAARTEEGENIRVFGQAYRDYITRTRMFVPYLF